MSEDNNSNQIESQQEPKDKEQAMIWDLEVWKRAQQAQFKAYLKQLEFEYLSQLQNDFKNKEEEREKEFKTKITELNNLKNKLSKKATQLESRENKIKLCEDELKLKMNEISKQLLNKDEEIDLIKKRHMDEQLKLQKNNIQLQKSIKNKESQIEKLEENFKNYKKEVEDSPISLLKNEITRKQIQNEELERQIQKLENEIKYKNQTIERLKVDMIKLRKNFETEKENMYKQRIEEIEKLKFEIYNKRTSSEEMKEIRELKEKIKELSMARKNDIGENNNNNNNNMNSTQQQINMQVGMFSPQSQQAKKAYAVISYNRKDNDNRPTNNLEKLIMERDQLLNSGMYKENDPLIFQINNKIKKMTESFGGYY
jgi:chromosome segregation ATPase